MTSPLRLSRTAVETIRRAAAASPEKEICGLLVGGADAVEAYETPNRHPKPENGFAVCDAAHARLQRQARAAGAKIVGCFHSHPSGETAPSETDLLAANGDGFIWVICAPDGRMQAWRAKVRSGLKSFEGVEIEPSHSAIAAAAAAL